VIRLQITHAVQKKHRPNTNDRKKVIEDNYATQAILKALTEKIFKRKASASDINFVGLILLFLMLMISLQLSRWSDDLNMSGKSSKSEASDEQEEPKLDFSSFASTNY
jgi:hypothetical protein